MGPVRPLKNVISHRGTSSGRNETRQLLEKTGKPRGGIDGGVRMSSAKKPGPGASGWSPQLDGDRPSSVLRPDRRIQLRRALGLSPREFEIVLHFMDGHTQSQIADRVGCSPHTIDSHVRRIFAKLGVSNRAGAVGRVFSEYLARESEAG